jgi:glycosyltransferase involved in cell wall biosynthesis
MTHPSEWPTLCEEYPVVNYLQHSIWANDVYKPYFGGRCKIWPVGIDTDAWRPADGVSKSTDLLIYNKIRWDYERHSAELLGPIRELITQRKMSYRELRYGFYSPQEYRVALNQSRAMIFLCEHESQGIAYQECLSSNVPVLAWDPGECLDPNRFKWGMPHIPATSVPYWDERCGIKFKHAGEFEVKLDEFLDKLNNDKFASRDYIIENLTLEKCALHYLHILDEAQR